MEIGVKRLILGISFLFLGLNSAGLLHAQQEEVFKLGEIVVTATRRQIPLKDVPANVTVIDKKEIKSSPLHTIDDLLKSIPGVDTLESELTEKTKRSVRLRGVPISSF